ncbi:MAG: FAD-binding oxidoreductase [Myxococcota bacterium]
MSLNPDFVVIGAGIAGASAAHALQERGEVVLLEREALPGHHTTGRSAAFLVESYGPAPVRALTRVSRRFLADPPDGFSEIPLVHPNPMLWIAREDQRKVLEEALEEGRAAGSPVEAIDVSGACEVCPVLREDYVAAATIEWSALHIDVAALLDAFIRGFRRQGGHLVGGAPVERLVREGDGWQVDAGGERYSTPTVINAAGAWADVVGQLAGAESIGLRPLRRTAITFEPPAGADVSSWPCVVDADEDFYFKPEGVRLRASPCDETPMEPCDVLPDDYEVALVAELVQRATHLEIRHIENRWAGLRNFVADRSPVIGFDPARAGFFWLAGQGGFGIMTAPAAAQAAAGLIADGRLPDDLAAEGLRAEALSPARLPASSKLAPAAS